MKRRTSNANRLQRGFTLIELIVVIAIIVLLAAIISGVMSILTGTKDLTMTGNAVDAYISSLRSKALTSQHDIIVVCFPQTSDGYEILTLAPDGEGSKKKLIYGGFVAFERIPDTDFEPGVSPQAQQRYVYMAKDLIFEDELDSEVKLHPEKLKDWAARSEAIRNLGQDFELLGKVGAYPDGSSGVFLFVIKGDGRVEIPDNVGVPLLDADPRERDADIVFHDGDDTLLIDISNFAKVTDRFYRGDAIEGSRFAPIEGE